MCTGMKRMFTVNINDKGSWVKSRDMDAGFHQIVGMGCKSMLNQTSVLKVAIGSHIG